MTSGAASSTFEPRRLPRAWRWAGIVMRALHMAAVVALGAALMGAPRVLPMSIVGSTLLITGVMLFALELWKTRDHWRQVAGLAALAKLVLIVWMIADHARALPLFWVLLLWSTVFAHAPASLRHAQLWGGGAPPR